MSEVKTNWIVTIFFGIAIGLGVLVILKTSLRDSNPREQKKLMMDLKLINQAIEQYKSFHGHYPYESAKKIFNFAEQLSEQMPDKTLKDSRKMFVDYSKNFITVDNENYAAPNADPTTLLDPWGEPYRYEGGEIIFKVWSTGPDKVNSNGAEDDVVLVKVIKGQDKFSKEE